MQKKAVVLLSGGLDSTLALKLMLDDGVEVFFIGLFPPQNFSQFRDVPGPIVLLKSNCDEITLKTAAEICVRYSDFKSSHIGKAASVLVREKENSKKAIDIVTGI